MNGDDGQTAPADVSTRFRTTLLRQRIKADKISEFAEGLFTTARAVPLRSPRMPDPRLFSSANDALAEPRAIGGKRRARGQNRAHNAIHRRSGFEFGQSAITSGLELRCGRSFIPGAGMRRDQRTNEIVDRCSANALEPAIFRTAAVPVMGQDRPAARVDLSGKHERHRFQKTSVARLIWRVDPCVLEMQRHAFLIDDCAGVDAADAVSSRRSGILHLSTPIP